MQKLTTLLALICFSMATSNAQVRLASGLEYRLVKKGSGKKTAAIGDYIAVILKGVVSGNTIFDTKTMNKGQNLPVNFKVQKKMYNGDVIEALQLLHEGDSAIITIPQDSFYRMPPNQRPKFVKPGDKVTYYVGVSAVKTAAQFNKEQEDYKKSMAAMAKQQAEFKKQQAAAAKAIKMQDADIKKYLAANNITNATRMPTGMYVVVDNPGTGEAPKTGYSVTMNYDGKLLNGKKFDSNIDTTFKHVQPFTFTLGKGQVIQGWDQGVPQFKKGGKGKLIIPSSMGYGSAPQNNIPANSVLIFDIEMLDFLDPLALGKEEDMKIQEFLKTNNITNAKKTKSGMYYVIEKEGSGPYPKTSDNITMNYTGMFLNGEKFDSNIDSTFGHTQAFNFACGGRSVIAGWEEAALLLQKGSKAKILLPSALAYGANGSGKIPANTVLQFDMELVDIKTPPPAAPKK